MCSPGRHGWWVIWTFIETSIAGRQNKGLRNVICSWDVPAIKKSRDRELNSGTTLEGDSGKKGAFSVPLHQDFPE